ncbi:hypothetical protein Tco_1422383, partial [Tanacetum coccineum]
MEVVAVAATAAVVMVLGGDGSRRWCDVVRVAGGEGFRWQTVGEVAVSDRVAS